MSDPRRIGAEKIAELWMAHSNQMWRAVYLSPLIAATLFAGWYAVLNAGQVLLAGAIAAVAILSMVLQFLIVHRMAQYDGALFEEVAPHLPEPGQAPLSFSGKTLARFVPLVLGFMFLCILGVTATAPEALVSMGAACSDAS